MTDQASLDPVRYDRWFDSPWGCYALGVEVQALRKAVGELRNRRVLDVGCGTGRFSAALKAAGATVVGLDIDPGMIALASQRIGGPLVVGDALRLPFRAGCFDTTIAVTALEFLADPPGAIRELARVTRIGGRVVVAVLNRASPWGLASWLRRRSEPWMSTRLLSPPEVGSWCREHGPVERAAALFVPGSFPGIRHIGPVLEGIGRAAPSLGAFQVFIIERR